MTMKTKSKPERRLASADERLPGAVSLRASEIRYRRLFETAHDGVLLVNPGTRKITDANPFMTKMLGYTRKQLVGKELFEIGLLKDEVASQEMFRKLKRKHEVRYEDLPLESQGGRHQEVEVVANLYQEDGHAVIQCNIRDITQRKQAELALSRLAAIVEFSDDAIIGKDLKGIITSWNNGAKKIFGYSAREMVGTSIMRLIPSARRDEEKQILARIRRGEGMRHFDTLRRTKDGRLINVSVTISPIKDAAGKVVGASKVARDISERKQAEAVQSRMEVLGVSNLKLRREIVRREQVEASLKKSEQHQRQLLTHSHHMQEQLRQLSRQILLTQEEERREISRELHDVIAQTLTGINVRLAALAKQAATNTTGLDRNIARTQRLVEKSVDIVHQFARELRPAVLDDLGLIPALHSFVKVFSKRTRILVHLKAFAEVEQIGIAQRTVLFRVAQEALTNVARHAHASRVEVSIQKLPDSVCMKIKDDGKSFQVDRVLHAKGSKRLGLLGMRERLEMVGGHFSVESVQGKGTTVIAQLPNGKARGGGESLIVSAETRF
jgi:PAS domain S-box-containing protein